LPPATNLNRLAVLFRYILVIPVNLLVTLTENGLFVLGIFAWVAALITGWLPTPFYDAYRAFVRYQARLIGYFFLLVPTYPRGLFGEETPPPEPVAAQPVPMTPAGWPEPWAPQPPALARMSQIPAAWRLTIGRGATILLAAAIIVGIPTVIVLNVADFSGRGQPSGQQALVRANNQLVDDVNHFESTLQNCATASCLEQANQLLALQLGAFISNVQAAGDAGVPAQVVDQMKAAAHDAEAATAAVSKAGPSMNGFQNAVAREQADQKLSALQSAQHRFVTALNNS
jgi:hypothetical protein